MALSDEVNDHFFPNTGRPEDRDTILGGYLNIFSDVNFNAMGTVFARKLSEKVTMSYMLA